MCKCKFLDILVWSLELGLLGTACHSSQVMVSITDLASDGEYSVTAAGRDGAGRLGQESEELTIRHNKKLHNIIIVYCSNLKFTSTVYNNSTVIYR